MNHLNLAAIQVKRGNVVDSSWIIARESRELSRVDLLSLVRTYLGVTETRHSCQSMAELSRWVGAFLSVMKSILFGKAVSYRGCEYSVRNRKWVE